MGLCWWVTRDGRPMRFDRRRAAKRCGRGRRGNIPPDEVMGGGRRTLRPLI